MQRRNVKDTVLCPKIIGSENGTHNYSWSRLSDKLGQIEKITQIRKGYHLLNGSGVE